MTLRWYKLIRLVKSKKKYFLLESKTKGEKLNEKENSGNVKFKILESK